MNAFPRLLSASLVALALIAPVAHASDSGPSPEAEAKLRTDLTAQGYEVRKIEAEDDMVEVYAIKDGKTVELYLDADLKIVKTKSAD